MGSMILGLKAVTCLSLLSCVTYANSVVEPTVPAPVVSASLHPEWHKSVWPPASSVVATEPAVPREVPKPVKRFYSSLG